MLQTLEERSKRNLKGEPISLRYSPFNVGFGIAITYIRFRGFLLIRRRHRLRMRDTTAEKLNRVL